MRSTSAGMSVYHLRKMVHGQVERKYPTKVECRLEIEQRQKDISGESLYGIMKRIGG